MLDGWNWEDAVYKADIGVALNLAAVEVAGDVARWRPRAIAAPGAETLPNVPKKLLDILMLICQAKLMPMANPLLKTCAFQLGSLINGSKKLFVNADAARESYRL